MCHVGPWGERNVVVVTPFEVAAGQLVMHLERLVGGETEVAKLHMHDGLVRVVAVKVYDHNHRVCLAGAGKTTTLRLLAHLEEPDTGSVDYGHGCKIGYFAQEHDTLDLDATVLQNLIHVAPELDDTQARSILGSFLFSGDDALKPARVLSGGEKTRLALATLVTSRANVLLLDEPTNNLDPASRDEILKAIAKYEGAIVLVTHDEGAVQALNPERVLLMPDGDEDLWNDSYLELVAEE